MNSSQAVSIDTQRVRRSRRSSRRRERAQGVPTCAPALPKLLPRSRALYGLRSHIRAPVRIRQNEGQRQPEARRNQRPRCVPP